MAGVPMRFSWMQQATAGIGRRRLITLFGGAAAAGWPLAAYAQQAVSVRRIGVLTGYIESDSEAQRRVNAFRQKLQELGWTDSRNIRIDYRWAAADRERIQTHAAEVVALKPDVILAVGMPVLQALQRETRSLPTVFVQVDDPVGAGVVSSLARPGGNITGFTPFELSMGGKMIELLKEMAPGIARVGFLMNPDSVFHAGMQRVMEMAAASFGIQLTSAGVRDAAEIDRAIDMFAAQPNGALVVPSYTLANVHRARIIASAARHRLPAIYPFRHFVADGGLVSYGIEPADHFRDAATYVHRILKGEKAGDLPVQAPTRFELVVNQKTAKTLGLTVPPTLLVHADEVIE